jgi:hypothetical protein
MLIANLIRISASRVSLLLFLLVFAPEGMAGEKGGVWNPLHGYWTCEPKDRFSKLKEELKAGRVTIDTSSERAALDGLLRALEIPASSQTLVYSTTSLQKGLIQARSPRALYFNDDTYLGYVSGGRMEVASLDPALGSIFYSIERVRPGRPLRAERERNCMNCHAPDYLGNIPALVLESVVPETTGGGGKVFRHEQSGHGVAFGERFGGWYVTGDAGFAKHWGNQIIEYGREGRYERVIAVGELFDIASYPVATSDLLAHLLHEHQVGFVNRVLVGTYRTRELLDSVQGRVEEVSGQLDELARGIVRYSLFADEVPLPAGGIVGDAAFKSDFLASRRRSASGASLKDFDLRTRLLRYRCSYKIYSPIFAGIPVPLKERVLRLLVRALEGTEPEFAYLPEEERRGIRAILRETLPEMSLAWTTKVPGIR